MVPRPNQAMTFLGVAGSLRRASYNRGLIRAAIEVAPPGTRMLSYDLADIPMFNADVEARGDPRPVAAFKRAIAAADALVIATPEYNHCIPGVLKNAIDWASLPARHSVLTEKPIRKSLAAPRDEKKQQPWTLTLPGDSIPADGLFFRLTAGDGKTRLFHLLVSSKKPPSVRSFISRGWISHHTGTVPLCSTSGATCCTLRMSTPASSTVPAS